MYYTGTNIPAPLIKQNLTLTKLKFYRPFRQKQTNKKIIMITI